MKFGRYLAENLTPEWKRAYIDYRACKKAIKVIASRLGDGHPDGQVEDEGGNSSDGDDGDGGPSAPPRRSLSTRTGPGSAKSGPESGRMAPMSPASGTHPESRGGVGSPANGISRSNTKKIGLSPGYGATASSPRNVNARSPVPPPLDLGEPSYSDDSTLKALPLKKSGLGQSSITVEHEQPPSKSSQDSHQSSDGSGDQGYGLAHSDSGQPLTTAGRSAQVKESPNLGKSPRFLQSPRLLAASKNPTPKTALGGRRSLRSNNVPSPRSARDPPPAVRSFDELYETLEDDEKAFFDLLEKELEKVEDFYAARVTEAQRRAHDLRDQLRELAEHRKVFHELYPKGLPEWEVKVGRILPVPGPSTGLGGVARQIRKRLPFGSTDESGTGAPDGAKQTPNGNGASPHPADRHVDAREEQRKQKLREAMRNDVEHHTYSPERYSKYKRDLRDASMEFYRQLELIKNYRIMNLTGFRKALKKFEKTTKIHCMELYTDERISKCTFAKGRVIDDLLEQTEQLYTEHFEHGDQKKARDKLRRQQREKTHYFSVFRSGIFLGLAVPPAVLALVKACEPETRDLLPGWDGLLQIYGGFYIAVIFALLFQLNLYAYVGARINYEFVMEMSNPTIDYRAFAEIPAFLFLTLSYCFFFTFYRVSPEKVDPTTWPLAWLVFVCVFFLNPLDIFRRRSRYWLLRVLFRVCTPGYSRVEFIAFFVADELNSLTYTIQNFYFLGCEYSHHFPRDTYSVCPSGSRWPYALLLCLPALVRLIQCVKRWHDSRLGIHLINAGKYLISIVQLCLFVLWRARGRSTSNASFIVWVLVSTATSVYTSAWDLIVDWSLFRPQSGLLRHDRGYSSRYVYYFAMASNVLIRFIWVWYIPDAKQFTHSRSFYFAVAEMLRRWQWNFFRVETEHLGNADAYRVTREIPLPYRRIEHDSDEDDKQPALFRSITKTNPITVHLDRLRRELVGEEQGRGPDAENLGPRGHARQREYEARRPGDTESDEPIGAA